MQVLFLLSALDMRVVSRVLSTGMQGGDVRDFHDKLEELGLFVPPVERSRGLFGPGTKRAVMEVQRKHFSYSRVTGILDQATANLIDMETGRED